MPLTRMNLILRMWGAGVWVCSVSCDWVPHLSPVGNTGTWASTSVFAAINCYAMCRHGGHGRGENPMDCYFPNTKFPPQWIQEAHTASVTVQDLNSDLWTTVFLSRAAYVKDINISLGIRSFTFLSLSLFSNVNTQTAEKSADINFGGTNGKQ